MDESSKIDFGGLSDNLVQDVKDTLSLLNTLGEISLVTDEEETKQLLAEFADCRINVFDGHTTFQNIIKLNGLYFIQLRKQMFHYNGDDVSMGATKSHMVREYTNEYELSLIGYKRLKSDYGKLSIEPGGIPVPFLTKLLSHLFSSDQVFISGHETFNNRYNVHATDKAAANSLLSDTVLDLVSNYENVILSVVQDKLVLWYPGIGKTATEAVLNIFNALRI